MPEIITTGRIYCIEDAHTRSLSAGNQHASNVASVAVGRHADGYQCYGFFKFAAHGIPENAVIVSAVLGGRVYQRLQAAKYVLTVRPAGGAWTDTEITYKTMPTSVGVSDTVTMGDTGSRFEADFTSVAQSWFGGNFDYANGLYITSAEANSYKRVYSCTAAEADRPYIILTYYVPASVPTADRTAIRIEAGAEINIAANRMSDDYTHALTWSMGGKSGAIAAGVTDAYKWTLTAADVSALMAALPDSASGTLGIVCETFDAAGASLGTESVSLAANVPAEIVPAIDSVAFTDNGKRLDMFWAGVSAIGIETAASPGAGSAIASISVSLGGKTYAGASVTVPLETPGSGQQISITATDARGRTSSAYTRTIDVLAYTAPAAEAFAIERCNADGTAPQIDGEHLRFTLYARALLVGTAQTNRLRVEIYTKLRSASEWTLAGSYGDESNVISLENALLPGTYSPLSSFDVLLRLTDTYGTRADRQTVVTTATCLVHYSTAKKQITFGRVGEASDPEHAAIFAIDAHFRGEIYLPDGRTLAQTLADYDLPAAEGARF